MGMRWLQLIPMSLSNKDLLPGKRRPGRRQNCLHEKIQRFLIRI